MIVLKKNKERKVGFKPKLIGNIKWKYNEFYYNIILNTILITITNIILPFLFLFIFDNNCYKLWVLFWKPCRNNPDQFNITQTFISKSFDFSSFSNVQ